MTSNIDYWGKRFGYPDCCIESFKERVSFSKISEERRKASLYGYVPCEACAKGILTGSLDIQKSIQANRKEPRPFKEYVLPSNSIV